MHDATDLFRGAILSTLGAAPDLISIAAGGDTRLATLQAALTATTIDKLFVLSNRAGGVFAAPTELQLQNNDVPYGGERFTDRHGVFPCLQTPTRAFAAATAGYRVRFRIGHGRVRGVQFIEQFPVEVAAARGHEIDDRHANAFFEQSLALVHKGLAALGAIFIGRADEFDRRDELEFVESIVDANLVFRGNGYFRFE